MVGGEVGARRGIGMKVAALEDPGASRALRQTDPEPEHVHPDRHRDVRVQRHEVAPGGRGGGRTPEVGRVAAGRIGARDIAHPEPEGEQRSVAYREEGLPAPAHPGHVRRAPIGVMGEALVENVDRGVLDIGLPVRLDAAPGAGENPIVLHRHCPVEIVFVEQPVEGCEVVVQGPRLPAEVQEKQAEPAFGRDLHEVGVAPSEAGGSAFRRTIPIRGTEQAAAQIVTPAVVVDLDLARRALLGTQREAAVVGTDVVKGAQHRIVAAHQQHRLSEELDRAHVAGLGQGRLEGGRHPAAMEDALHLEVEEGAGREGPRGQGQRPLDGRADRRQLLAAQTAAHCVHVFAASSRCAPGAGRPGPGAGNPPILSHLSD